LTDLFVRESGSPDQPAVVFLHAVVSTSGMWQGHMAELSEYHCIAPDLPGHGQSRAVRWSSLADTADRVIALLEPRLGGRRASLVGLSLGGAVAYEVLSRKPEMFDHAVIDGCGAVASRTAVLAKAAAAIVSPFIGRPVVGRFVARSLGLTSRADIDVFVRGMSQTDPVSFRRALTQAQDVRISEGLLSARTRTLFVAGEKELAAVRGSNRLLADLMPSAECRMVPGVGHGWLASQPSLHVAMVRAWVQDGQLPPGLQPETSAPARAHGSAVHP
jgi:pimeloyl-ACP methyl ester carboxylesterase